jgi:hypothetical protein
MRTYAECLAKADEFDRIGYHSLTQTEREEYARLAQGWRRTALLARQQEAWGEPFD